VARWSGQFVYALLCDDVKHALSIYIIIARLKTMVEFSQDAFKRVGAQIA
jgi:hypothetical protein